ncbi:MAG: hypothetical protein ACYTCU_08125 [Planctomycetota bacterium]|jgi:hypothetical protein
MGPLGRTLLPTGVVCTLAWLAIGRLGPLELQARAFVGWYALAFAAYALACRAVLAARAPLDRRWLIALLALAVAQRLAALPVPPSDDVYRYLWEAEVQSHGGNPYVSAPDAPELAGLAERSEAHGRVNHPGWTAIYPPLAQLWQRGVAAIRPDALGMTLSFLLAEVLLVVFLLGLLAQRGLSHGRVLIYAWNPLSVHAVAAHGHHDSLGAALLVGALLALGSGKRVPAAALGVAAALSKGFALVALPVVLATRRLAPWLVAVGLVALAVFPFRDAGPQLFGSLRRFGAELHSNDSLHALARGALGAETARVVMAAVWLLAAAWVLRRGPTDAVHRVAFLLGALLLVLPTVHPWYLLVLLPLLCVHPWWGWLALSGTSALIWLGHEPTGGDERWTEQPLLKIVEYAPLFGWLVWVAARRARATPAPPAPPASPGSPT